jgi:hypothetical protein
MDFKPATAQILEESEPSWRSSTGSSDLRWANLACLAAYPGRGRALAKGEQGALSTRTVTADHKKTMLQRGADFIA